MSKKKIIILGSGGHAKSCIDVINKTNKFIISGIIEKENKIITDLKIPILGTDADLILLRKKFKYAFIAIGQIKSPKIRISKFLQLKKQLFLLPKIVSPTSYFSKNSYIDEGTIVLHNCVINSGVNVGKNNVINTGTLIEHDVEIGNYNHISTGVIVNGNVKIGNANFIGSGAIIYNGIKIGNNCIISSGSIIRNNIPNNKTFK